MAIEALAPWCLYPVPFQVPVTVLSANMQGKSENHQENLLFCCFLKGIVAAAGNSHATLFLTDTLQEVPQPGLTPEQPLGKFLGGFATLFVWVPPELCAENQELWFCCHRSHS